MRRMRCIITAALLCTSAVAMAQAWPQRPVRLMVGFAPGGSTDITARLYAQEYARLWGTQVLVDNRPGASGLIGAELTAKAAPDGHTLLVSPQTSTVIAPLILRKVSFDPVKDFAPLGVIGSTPQLLVLHPSVPAKNFREFAAFVKTHAKSLAFASGGIGSAPHMSGELFNASLGIKVTHVPYKGENPGVADVLGGQIAYMFANFPVVYQHVQAGKLRAVAISSPRRSPLAPAVPTVAESGIPGFATESWSGFYAPAATPREVVQKISADTLKIKADPPFRKRMLDQGIDQSEADTPEKHAAFLTSEFARWGKLIREADVRE